MRKIKQRPFRIIGAYDSETTNYDIHGAHIGFPILHQLGFVDPLRLPEVTPDDVEEAVEVELYRNSLDLFARLDEIVEERRDYVPVILCHNLSFDMYGLSPWLNRHDVRVLAKSARKPITFTIRNEAGEPALVIWDTLIFTQQSLERMGADCGYSKGAGLWDYGLIRTPSTPLTPDEVEYSKRDIYTLICWLAWWMRRNPDIESEKLGINVVTKTGVVRERRRVRFAKLKGKGRSYDVERYWLLRNRNEAAKSDDELFTNLACTRGGFTFCSSVNASRPFDLAGTDAIIAAYDATSQHPAQLVSHLYPVRFREQEQEVLELAFELISKVTLDRVLNRWDKPFPVAFNACFEFTGLRPKPGSIWERYGVLPLASARYVSADEDNGDKAAHDDELASRGYRDSAEGAVCAFGKLVSADTARLYITELTAWEIAQCYEWDSVRAVHGYSTGRFTKPSDMDVLSVMQFYKAKNAYKEAREEFYSKGTISNGDDLEALGIAPAIVHEMKEGTISNGDVEATYLGLKADLNAIFGISCSNEYRRDTVLTPQGISYEGAFGICNAPKNSKVWYQFGQRIVGWSRIAQVVAMELMARHSDTIVNGDTDSVKVLTDKGRLPLIDRELAKLGHAIDKGKEEVCSRVRAAFPDLYDPLEGIGHYVHEFSADRFCASWNKAYCMQEYSEREGCRRFSFTLAGIPTKRRVGKSSCFIGIDGLADRLYLSGMAFSEVCDIFLGYNVTYANDIIRLNARAFPEWGSMVYEDIEDYRGERSKVAEPAALALYPMGKTINDTASAENRANMAYAKQNNPDVNTNRLMVFSGGIIDMGEVRF